MWKGYNNNVYYCSEVEKAFNEAFYETETEIVTKGKIQYFNVPASFDIEVTSFYANDINGNEVKSATMYIWQLGLNGTVIYGRTWDEFFELLFKLVDYLELDERRHLVIFVHNLGYEFQFLRKWIEWDKVFAIKNRRPVYAIAGGLEFRCSLFLSNYALKYIGDELLKKYPVKKLVGELDYLKIRNSKTPLTEKELQYCINDVKVVMCYIQEKIENEGDITNIPLTNTGYVRNFCRESCFTENGKSGEEAKSALFSYRALMKNLTIDTEEEYNQLKAAFMGGFTHASILHVNKILHDIGSADLTSSYPYTIVAQYFPMSKCEYIGRVDSESLFKYYLENYCCIFDIEFTNIQPLVEFENTISESRCYCEGKKIVNNGRIVSAEKLQTTLTELDYDTVSKFYKWDNFRITNLRIYRRDYLPRPLILAVLQLYEKKTKLKGIEDKHTEYMVSKNMINAAFGMMVTNIIRDEFVYNEDWLISPADTISQLTSYNKNFNRFLFYAWGVWVTAHARHNLFSAIYEFKEDYVYADTDSIKGLNFDKHMKYFKNYNNNVFNSLLKMCNTYNIPFSMCQPETNKGIKKLIGEWEIEEGYKRFKTVGAKRYIYEYPDGKLSMTVAGLNKKNAIPYLLEKYKTHDLVFEVFGEDMYIPAGHTGKNNLTYIDKEQSGFLTDYLGNTAPYHELSSIHMEPEFYRMTILDVYLKLMRGVQYVEI